MALSGRERIRTTFGAHCSIDSQINILTRNFCKCSWSLYLIIVGPILETSSVFEQRTREKRKGENLPLVFLRMDPILKINT
jgi:hypothetical protein